MLPGQLPDRAYNFSPFRAVIPGKEYTFVIDPSFSRAKSQKISLKPCHIYCSKKYLVSIVTLDAFLEQLRRLFPERYQFRNRIRTYESMQPSWQQDISPDLTYLSTPVMSSLKNRQWLQLCHDSKPSCKCRQFRSQNQTSTAISQCQPTLPR